MTRPILIVSTLLLLTGCNAHVASVAGYMLVDPVMKVAWQSGNTIELRLEKVKGLLDRGLISEDEAAEKRKEILDNL